MAEVPIGAVSTRSAARQKLADAIEALAAAERRLAEVTTASERAEAMWRAAAASSDRADEALVEARARAGPWLAAAILARRDPGASPVAAAEEALRAARDEAAMLREACAALETELTAATADVRWERDRHADALGRAVADDPATARLLAEHAEARHRASDLGAALRVLGLANALPGATRAERGAWQSERLWPNRGLAEPWKAALAALQRDPDAELPQ